MSIVATEISTKYFTWDSENRCFVGEASMLEHASKNFRSRVFDDACDEGFVMVSQWTGAKIPVILSKILTRENELAGWTFVSYKAAKPFNVTIFND